MSFAWAFMADGHSSIDFENQSVVTSLLNRSSIFLLLVAGMISFMASGIRSVCVLDRVISSSRLMFGGPLCHAAICVA